MRYVPILNNNPEIIHYDVMELVVKWLAETFKRVFTIREVKKFYDEKMSYNNQTLLVKCFDLDRLAGFGIFKIQEFGFVEGQKDLVEDSVFVDPDYRGKGILKGFSNMALEFAKENGCQFVNIIPSIHGGNHEIAKDILLKEGYNIIGYVLRKEA